MPEFAAPYRTRGVKHWKRSQKYPRSVLFEMLATPFDGLRTSSLLRKAAISVSLRGATQSPVSKGTKTSGAHTP